MFFRIKVKSFATQEGIPVEKNTHFKKSVGKLFVISFEI